MAIPDISRFVGKGFPRVMTLINIQSSFRLTGIYPLDRNIFPDADNLLSDVTDRSVSITVSAATEDSATSLASVISLTPGH